MSFLKKNRKKGEKTILYNYNYADLKNIVFLLYARMIGYKIILDIIEDNRFERPDGFVNRFRLKTSIFLFRFSRKFTDYFVAISEQLYERVEQNAKGKVPVSLIPITVNLNYFKRNGYHADKNNLKIFYGGSYAVKDGLKYLSDAFDVVSKNALPVVVKNYDAPEGNIPAGQLTDTVKHSGARSLFVDPKVGWSPSVAMTYSDLTSRDHLWVRFTSHVYVPPGSPRVDCALAVCMEHRAQKYGDRVRPIAPEELVPGQWNEVSMWFLTPAVRDGDDLLYGYLWLRDTVPVWIDDARIEPFERKE